MADFREALIGNLIQRLFQSAQARPDIGEAQPVATMMGRVAHPGDTPQSVLSRPAGDLEQASPLDALKATLLPLVPGAAAKGVAASIPLAVWKGMSEPSRASLTSFSNKFPATFEKILKEPDVLQYEVTRNLSQPSSLGEHQLVMPGVQQVKVHPDYQSGVAVPAHEVTHYLKDASIAKMRPIDAETAGLLLGEQIATAGLNPASLGKILNKFGATPGYGWLEGRPGEMIRNWNISNANIPGEAGMSFAETAALRKALHALPGNEPIRKNIGHEGFAHLAQFTADKGAPQLLKLLAKRLGILPE